MNTFLTIILVASTIGFVLSIAILFALISPKKYRLIRKRNNNDNISE